MKKILSILLIGVLLLVPAAALAEDGASDGDELLFNGDFAVAAETAPLPAGWEFVTYQGGGESALGSYYADEDCGNVLELDNFVRNDSRAVQTVEVTPNTVYRIVATVRTEDVYGDRGANLSIDNYGIDGTYCYSPDVVGTSDWQQIELYVRTGADQTQLSVALRLGGYGTMCTGKACFESVSCRVAGETGAASVVDLPSENGASGTSTGSAPKGPLSESTVFTVMLLVTAAVALLSAWLYIRGLRDESLLMCIPKEKSTSWLYILLAAAFVLRLVLSLVFVGHSTDLNCFMAWGNAVLNGPAQFYTSGMFADYPPGYMYVCGLLAAIGNALGLSYGSAGYVFLFKLPSTAADLAAAYLLYRIAKKNGVSESFSVAIAAIFVFCPVLAYVSGAWGQIDSLLMLLLVLVIFLLQKDKRIAAGALYGLAILIKPQALMLGPLLAAVYIIDIPGKTWKKRLIETVLAVAAAFAVIFLASLPFKGTQRWDWIIQKYVATSGSYPYASIEAFNFFALVGGNWARDAETLLGITYKTWGTIGIVLSVAASILFYYKGRRGGNGAAYLAGALLLTGVFTLGHYMHERYLLPALLLLLMAYLYYRDRRLLLTFLWLSTAALLNVLAAMYIINHQTARGTFYDVITRVSAAVEVLGFGYLVYTAASICWHGRSLRPLPAPQNKPAIAKAAEPELPVLPDGPTDTKLHYTKKDYILLLSLTAVYGVTAILNLGTLKSPESFWETSTTGEVAFVEFDEPTFVSEIWVHGNIMTGGTLLFSADDGAELTYAQTYDDMFRWDRSTFGTEVSEMQIMLYSGAVKINEIAFIGADGKPIAAHLMTVQGSQAGILDEQDTVPEYPSYFNGMYFDELYHGRTAYEHLHGLKPYENSHPPLGKILISLGIAVFGMNPFGWRIVGTLLGICMLPILYAFGKRMFKRSSYAFLTAALFAVDFMHFTQTRIATIDVYGVFFILLMFYYMYQYISMNFFVDGVKRTLRPLGLAGLFFGLGAASKWICFYAGGGLAVLFFWSLITRYREYRAIMKNGTKAERKQVAGFWLYTAQTLAWCCLFYLLIPALIYFASYLPYYLYEAKNAASYGLKDAFATFWNYQDFMYSYHSGLTATHSYQSSWYMWPFTLRPMWYYFGQTGAGEAMTLTASGNPAVWWISSVGAVALFVLWSLGKIKKDRALQVICIGILANFLPWTLVSRCTFIYHFFATVPFILLATVYLLKSWEDRDPAAKPVKWVWLALALLLFILLYPGISGCPISYEWGAFLKKLPGGGMLYGL